MPGFLLHQGAAVMCAHGGQMAVIEPNPRVCRFRICPLHDHCDAVASDAGLSRSSGRSTAMRHGSMGIGHDAGYFEWPAFSRAIG